MCNYFCTFHHSVYSAIGNYRLTISYIEYSTYSHSIFNYRHNEKSARIARRLNNKHPDKTMHFLINYNFLRLKSQFEFEFETKRIWRFCLHKSFFSAFLSLLLLLFRCDRLICTDPERTDKLIDSHKDA